LFSKRKRKKKNFFFQKNKFFFPLLGEKNYSFFLQEEKGDYNPKKDKPKKGTCNGCAEKRSQFL